jgi:hypothetical protein
MTLKITHWARPSSICGMIAVRAIKSRNMIKNVNPAKGYPPEKTTTP